MTSRAEMPPWFNLSYNDWLQTLKSPTLRMPPNVVDHTFISPNLHQVENIDMVRAVPVKMTNDSIGVFVVADRGHNLVDPDFFESYALSKDLAVGRSIPELQLMFPGFVKSGRLSLRDEMIYSLEAGLYVNDNKAILSIREYEDFSINHGKHVTSALFRRIRQVAKDMGVYAMAGFNNEANLWFFRDYLGRITFDRIKPEYRDLFYPEWQVAIDEGKDEGFDIALHRFTVDIFDPTEIDKYLIK